MRPYIHIPSFDNCFRYFNLFGTFLFFLIFLMFFGLSLKYSLPAFNTVGKLFFTHSHWAPNSHEYGALSIIIGTLITGILSLIIAVPISFLLAVGLVFYFSRHVFNVISRFIDILSGIPSIIFGMWGLFYLAPILSQSIEPKLINLFENVPLLNHIFSGLPIGIGYFTAGIILAIMVVPYISSLIKELILEVPKELIEAAQAVGCTQFELIFKVIVPYIRAGLLGSIILGLGRALGETMAVTFVIGNAQTIFSGLFMPGSTIASTIANEFNETTSKLHESALFELGLVLFLITALFLFLSRVCLHRAKPRGGNL